MINEELNEFSAGLKVSGHEYHKEVIDGENIFIGDEGILGVHEVLITWKAIKKIYILGKKQGKV